MPWRCSAATRASGSRRRFRRKASTARYVWTHGENRSSLSVADRETGGLTEFYEHGSEVPSSAWPELAHATAALFGDATWLTISGSLPAGIDDSAYRDLVAEARDAGVRVALDAEGDRLRLALEAQPDVVKVNASEASELLGVPTARRDEAMAAAQKLRELAGGDGHVGIVTRGADGVVVAAPDGALYEGVLYVRGRYPVGSGDAFLAGLVVALDRGDRLGRGVADGPRGGDGQRRAARRRPFGPLPRRGAGRTGDGPTHLMAVEIRRIGAGEWRELRDLRLRALKDAPDAFTATYEEESNDTDAHWSEWATELAEGGSSFGLVAESEGRWIGMAVGGPHRDFRERPVSSRCGSIRPHAAPVSRAPSSRVSRHGPAPRGSPCSGSGSPSRTTRRFGSTCGAGSPMRVFVCRSARDPM